MQGKMHYHLSQLSAKENNLFLFMTLVRLKLNALPHSLDEVVSFIMEELMYNMR